MSTPERRSSGRGTSLASPRSQPPTPSGVLPSSPAATAAATSAAAPAAAGGAGPAVAKPADPQGVWAKLATAAPAADKEQRDRMLYVTANMIGQHVEVQLVSGQVYQGIFHTSEFNIGGMGVVLHHAHPKLDRPANHTDIIDRLIVKAGDLAQVYVTGLDLVAADRLSAQANQHAAAQAAAAASGGGFQTDSAISGFSGAVRDRELVPWQDDDQDGEELGGAQLREGGSGGGNWDQFERNKQLFGVQSSYDETLYTTKIDQNSPMYRQRAMEAEALAADIMRRGGGAARNTDDMDDGTEADEEDKYSAVRRSGDEAGANGGKPGKYVTPARRAPAGRGAPLHYSDITNDWNNFVVSENSKVEKAKQRAKTTLKEQFKADQKTIDDKLKVSASSPSTDRAERPKEPRIRDRSDSKDGASADNAAPGAPTTASAPTTPGKGAATPTAAPASTAASAPATPATAAPAASSSAPATPAKAATPAATPATTPAAGSTSSAAPAASPAAPSAAAAAEKSSNTEATAGTAAAPATASPSTSKLNPSAKPFSFNVAAKAYVPSSAVAAPTTVPPASTATIVVSAPASMSSSPPKTSHMHPQRPLQSSDVEPYWTGNAGRPPAMGQPPYMGGYPTEEEMMMAAAQQHYFMRQQGYPQQQPMYAQGQRGPYPMPMVAPMPPPGQYPAQQMMYPGPGQPMMYPYPPFMGPDGVPMIQAYPSPMYQYGGPAPMMYNPAGGPPPAMMPPQQVMPVPSSHTRQHRAASRTNSTSSAGAADA